MTTPLVRKVDHDSKDEADATAHFGDSEADRGLGGLRQSSLRCIEDGEGGEGRIGRHLRHRFLDARNQALLSCVEPQTEQPAEQLTVHSTQRHTRHALS